jgi:hypothetical protein
MTDNRLPGETHRLETDFGAFYLHFDERPGDAKLAGFSISHQIKDLNSQIAELVDDIAKGVHDALRSRL